MEKQYAGGGNGGDNPDQGMDTPRPMTHDLLKKDFES
jgi:bifunctional DNase/RNase